MVVAGPASWVGRDPVTVRVRNVTTTGFEVRLTEWPYLDGNHTVETVSYLAVPAGRHTLVSGAVLEAGTSSVAATHSHVGFAAPFVEKPVLLSTVVAAASGPGLVSRTNVGKSGFSVRLHAEEADSGSYGGTVNWVAWSSGSDDGTGDGVGWETHNKAVNNSFTRFSFDRAYVRPCVLGDMNTLNGGDTANLRYRKLRVRSVRVRIDEEKSADAEVAHVAERVGLLVLECAKNPPKNPPVVTPGFGFGATLVGTPTVLWGEAYDDRAGFRVSLAVRHRASGEWLQRDGTFGSTIRRFDAVLANGGAGTIWSPDLWSLEVSLPDGDYSLSVRVWDADDNEVALAPWHHFTVAAEPTASGVILLADGDVGRYSSLELDAAGNPVIVYLNRTGGGDFVDHSGMLELIHCSDPDCGAFSGPFPLAAVGLDELYRWSDVDLELDAAGNPVVVPPLVHCVDPNCEQPPIIGNSGGTSLEIDAVGNPVLSGGGSTIAHCTDPNCVDPPISSIDLFPGQDISWTDLALDSIGNPVVAAWEWYDFQFDGGLLLAHCSDPNCLDSASLALVADEGSSENAKTLSLVLDAEGNPVLAVKEQNPEWNSLFRLHVIRCSDPNCAGPKSNHEIEDNQHAGMHASLGLSPSGLPIVAYDNLLWAYGSADLLLARCTDDACADPPHTTIIDNNFVSTQWVSMAVDDTGTAYISYYDANQGDLRFVRVPAP